MHATVTAPPVSLHCQDISMAIDINFDDGNGLPTEQCQLVQKYSVGIPSLLSNDITSWPYLYPGSGVEIPLVLTVQ